MSTYNNRRFPKVFVFNPATELVTSNASKPVDLTFGQVGIFNALTGVGATATPTQANCPVMRIAQNLGNNSFGIIQSKDINIQKVVSWRAVKATVGQVQTTYLGWNGTDGSLAAKVGQNIVIPITLYDRQIKQWYGEAGYTKRIVPNASVWAGLNEGDSIDQSLLADDIVAQINGTDAPAGTRFTSNLEFQYYVTAVKYSTGAAAGTYGIKFDTVAVPIELLNASDPKQFYKPNIRQFDIGAVQGDVAWKVKTTQIAKPGNGYPLQVTDAEKESQGYDLVRDQFEYSQNMKTNFVLRAVDGTKYDFYYLGFDWTHTNTATPGHTTDPYAIVFPVPTGQGANLEAVINNWLTPLGFTAVNISSGSAKGVGEIENA